MWGSCSPSVSYLIKPKAGRIEGGKWGVAAGGSSGEKMETTVLEQQLKKSGKKKKRQDQMLSVFESEALRKGIWATLGTLRTH